jgi:hypothetical protein
MLLFDAAPEAAESASLIVADPIRPACQQHLAPPRQDAALEHESGLNHMGDLARLVLLRYELVAKRRAARAARRNEVEAAC